MYGDDRRLAAFRRFCRSDFEMVLLDLPTDQAPAAVLCDIARTGDLIAGLIEKRQPTGPVRLMGYSFGGNVAFEAARRLVAAGRAVELVMVDAYLVDPDAGLRRQRRTIARRLFWRALGMIARSDAMRRSALGLTRRIRPDQHTGLARRLLWSLRSRATAVWRPLPVAAPILLVLSEPFAVGLGGWRGLLPDADILRLPCDHWDVLRPPAAASLRDALLTHFRSARATDTPA